MSDYAIRVEKLCKRYRIGLSKNRENRKYSGLKAIISPFGYLISSLREPSPDEVIWALNGVSLEVKQGEVMGIIGRNGAGKSTLLKILSRITEPTSGRVFMNGRVGSLLEVGTGFHPELTGRENIYLNGTILGMKRVEIERKFDEIVAFSEIEKFIDTPVKRYSSGMYVRLAFAVAAHLEPEILLVDEVLAVGDMAFQQKCLGKMGEAAKSGRTVLFVSHNMAAVQALCDNAVLIERGCLVFAGTSSKVVNEYSREVLSISDQMIKANSEHFELLDYKIIGHDGRMPAPLEPLNIILHIKSKYYYNDIGVHLLFEDKGGYRILGLDSRDFISGVKIESEQEVICNFFIHDLPLSPGPFNLRVLIKSQLDYVFDEVCLIPFTVVTGQVYNTREIDRQWHGMTVAHTDVEINVLH